MATKLEAALFCSPVFAVSKLTFLCVFFLSSQWYVAVIREQSSRDILSFPLRERVELQQRAEQTDMYWGYFWSEVGYVMGPQFDELPLAEAAKLEFAAIERILNRAFIQN